MGVHTPLPTTGSSETSGIPTWRNLAAHPNPQQGGMLTRSSLGLLGPCSPGSPPAPTVTPSQSLLCPCAPPFIPRRAHLGSWLPTPAMCLICIVQPHPKPTSDTPRHTSSAMLGSPIYINPFNYATRIDLAPTMFQILFCALEVYQRAK